VALQPADATSPWSPSKSELIDADQVIRVTADGGNGLLVFEGSDLSLVEVDGTTKRLTRTEFPAITGVTLRAVREIGDDVVPVEWTVLHPRFPSGRLTVDARALRPNERDEVMRALRGLVRRKDNSLGRDALVGRAVLWRRFGLR
jgi:hypothetical protein